MIIIIAVTATYRFTVDITISDVYKRQGDILNDLLAGEQGIQEANKNFFVQVGSKQ